MVLLPKKFTQFSDITLVETHHTMMGARNTIYAHTDAAAKPNSITINIRMKDPY